MPPAAFLSRFAPASRLLAGTALCLALPATQVAAAETTATFFLWANDVDQKLVGGTRLETSSKTLIENLEFGLMGALVHRRGPWLYGFDALYADVGKDGDVDVPVQNDEPDGPDSIGTALDFTSKTTLVHAYVGHEWHRDPNWAIYATGGVRYTRFETELTVDTDTGFAKRFETEENLTDATLGVRGHYAYTPHWSSPFILDVGTGSTEATLHAFTGLSYDWGPSSVTAAYRYMKWKLEDSDYLDQVIYEGPLLAFSYRF
ncbi:hypothetical protein ABE957_13910 [Halomonas sp. CS7]|uniref:Outer membrane protein beta-barrel domain-containing protein n=1 Tax=Halomonas pelophila TaxID=3151122 RepID=A0ABV1N7U3_9GAMM